jgi:hypothetical protein
MQGISRKELQPPLTACLPLSSDRAAAGQGAFVFTGALIGIVAWCQPAMAAACHVPAAVLCDGCVKRLSIRVTPGGACRVSFTAPVTPVSAEAGKFVDINVEAEPSRPAHRRVSTPHLSDAKPAAPLRPPAGCFVFNGRRFCE